jgi:hypothetical protein
MPRLTHILFLLVLLALASAARAERGYYWEWNQQPDPVKLKACVADMRKILAARHAVANAEAAPDAAPAKGVHALVGVDMLTAVDTGSDEGEPFMFPGRKGMNFIRAESAAFDEIVSACLIVARDHFTPEELGITGDAQWPAGWSRGAACYKEIFGREAQSPLSKTSAEGLQDTLDRLEQLDDESQQSTTPWWLGQAVWCGGAPVVLGILLYFMKPRYGGAGGSGAGHFQINVRNGKVAFTGKIPVTMEWTLREFFLKDVPINRPYKVTGRWSNQRLIIDVHGAAKEREQQIRNYLKLVMGRLPAPVD